MPRSIRVDAVLVQAVIAGALSFAHLHDLAEAAGQTGWKAWAYPISVDLLLVAAWRRLRTARRDRSAWTWFVIALVASLGANIATAGLLDLKHVPACASSWPAGLPWPSSAARSSCTRRPNRLLLHMLWTNRPRQKSTCTAPTSQPRHRCRS
jgi:hypothetical protein